MTKRTRLILISISVLIFVLITPIIILYARGYRWDPKQGSLVQTGGFLLRSIPKEANVYLNDKLKKQKTPIKIQGLLPGDYFIKVEIPGFHSWQKHLAIKSKLATKAENILLLSQNPEIISLTPDKVDDFIISENGERLIYQTGQSLWLINLDDLSQYELKEQEIDFLRPLQSLSKDKKKQLFWDANEIWVYYLKDIETEPRHQAGEKELIFKSSPEINQALWYEDFEHIIFSVGEQIKFAELDGRDYRNIIDFVKGEKFIYNKTDKNLYFLNNNHLYKVQVTKD